MNEEKVVRSEPAQKPKRGFKAVGCMLCVLAILAMSLLCCFADGGSAEAVSAVQSVFTDVTGTININSVVQILAIVVAACVGLVLMWFGIRKVIKIIMGAFRKGKISV